MDPVLKKERFAKLDKDEKVKQEKIVEKCKRKLEDLEQKYRKKRMKLEYEILREDERVEGFFFF